MILPEKEAEAFLKKEGFPVVHQMYCTSSSTAIAAAKRIGYPVAMKVVSPTIIHKSDVGGVALNLITDTAVMKHFTRMKRLNGFRGVLIQEYVEADALLLGLKRDSVFGHTVAVGAGGIYTEILKDVSFRACPVTAADAADMLHELKVYPIIAGTRGHTNKVKSVITIILKLSALAATYPQIAELDINPLLLTATDIRIVDARIVLN